MRKLRSTVLVLVLLLVGGTTAAVAQPPAGGGPPSLDVELVADGLAAPVDLTYAPDGSDRRFIVDQSGIVHLLTADGEVLPDPYLDISDRVVLQSAFDERGLLAVAFHPDFADNGKLYAHYSAEREGPNICVTVEGEIPDEPEGCPLQYTRLVSEFVVDPDADQVDESTERTIFKHPWPGRKHNGGGLAFGPDGMLYVGLGDGGWTHGPSGGGSVFDIPEPLAFGDNVAQDLSELYGKILRIDVDDDGFPADPDRNYAIPGDNPFVAGDAPDDARDEIYAWGFRNPFRISFDTGGDHSLIVSAPAETYIEAVYRVTGPGNYGWAVREGTHCLERDSSRKPGRSCPTTGPLGEPIHDPIVQYYNFTVERDGSSLPRPGFGRASIGGHIYRGDAIPGLQGQVVVGDFAINTFDGQILTARAGPHPDRLWRMRRSFVFDADDPDRAGFMRAIGRDADGELYAITGNSAPTGLVGKVWKIVSGSR